MSTPVVGQSASRHTISVTQLLLRLSKKQPSVSSPCEPKGESEKTPHNILCGGDWVSSFQLLQHAQTHDVRMVPEALYVALRTAQQSGAPEDVQWKFLKSVVVDAHQPSLEKFSEHVQLLLRPESKIEEEAAPEMTTTEAVQPPSLPPPPPASSILSSSFHFNVAVGRWIDSLRSISRLNQEGGFAEMFGNDEAHRADQFGRGDVPLPHTHGVAHPPVFVPPSRSPSTLCSSAAVEDQLKAHKKMSKKRKSTSVAVQWSLYSPTPVTMNLLCSTIVKNMAACDRNETEKLKFIHAGVEALKFGAVTSHSQRGNGAEARIEKAASNRDVEALALAIAQSPGATWTQCLSVSRALSTMSVNDEEEDSTSMGYQTASQHALQRATSWIAAALVFGQTTQQRSGAPKDHKIIGAGSSLVMRRAAREGGWKAACALASHLCYAHVNNQGIPAPLPRVHTAKHPISTLPPHVLSTASRLPLGMLLELASVLAKEGKQAMGKELLLASPVCTGCVASSSPLQHLLEDTSRDHHVISTDVVVREKRTQEGGEVNHFKRYLGDIADAMIETMLNQQRTARRASTPLRAENIVELLAECSRVGLWMKAIRLVASSSSSSPSSSTMLHQMLESQTGVKAVVGSMQGVPGEAAAVRYLAGGEIVKALPVHVASQKAGEVITAATPNWERDPRDARAMLRLASMVSTRAQPKEPLPLKPSVQDALLRLNKQLTEATIVAKQHQHHAERSHTRAEELENAILYAVDRLSEVSTTIVNVVFRSSRSERVKKHAASRIATAINNNKTSSDQLGTFLQRTAKNAMHPHHLKIVESICRFLTVHGHVHTALKYAELLVMGGGQSKNDVESLLSAAAALLTTIVDATLCDAVDPIGKTALQMLLPLTSSNSSSNNSTSSVLLLEKLSASQKHFKQLQDLRCDILDRYVSHVAEDIVTQDGSSAALANEASQDTTEQLVEAMEYVEAFFLMNTKHTPSLATARMVEQLLGAASKTHSASEAMYSRSSLSSVAAPQGGYHPMTNHYLSLLGLDTEDPRSASSDVGTAVGKVIAVASRNSWTEGCQLLNLVHRHHKLSPTSTDQQQSTLIEDSWTEACIAVTAALPARRNNTWIQALSIMDLHQQTTGWPNDELMRLIAVNHLPKPSQNGGSGMPWSEASQCVESYLKTAILPSPSVLLTWLSMYKQSYLCSSPSPSCQSE